MIARLRNNGLEVRVDLENTGQNWPCCSAYQPGFPWLAFGRGTWEAAEQWAREHGATTIIREGDDNNTECPTCEGTQRVTETVKHVLDAGTKWQQTCSEQVSSECPKCNGTGHSPKEDTP